MALVAIALGVMAAAGDARAETFTVRPLPVPELKAVYGQVESRTVLPARARIGGTIREIAVSEGSEVAEGEAIARVVDDKLALELDAARARIKELRSQLDNARTELSRTQQLIARGVVSSSRLDQARTQYDVVANQVAAAEAERAVVEQRAREGAVLAPASGRVLSVPVTLGSVILPGEPVARIASGPYYLRLALPERHAATIRQGAAVAIGRRGLDPSGDGQPATRHQGRIAKVYPEITEGRVIADVELAGIGDYFVNERTLVWIPIGSRMAIAVPPAALVTRHGIDYARLDTPQGPREVAVILGQAFEDAGERRIEVLTGLKDGDRLLLPAAPQ